MAIVATLLVASVVTLAIESYAGIEPVWKVLLPFALGFVAIGFSAGVLLIVLKLSKK